MGTPAPLPVPAETRNDLRDRVELELRAERLRLYQSMAISSVASQIVIAVLLVAVLRDVVALPRLLGWSAVLAVALLARMAAWHAQRRPPGGSAAMPDPLLRTRLALAGTGAAWGLAGVLLFPSNDLQAQTFLSFVLAGLAAGSLTLAAFDQVTSVGFAVLSLVPLSANLLVVGGPAGIGMALMALIFVAFLALIGVRAQRNVRDTVALRSAESLRAERLLRSQQQLQRVSTELTLKTDALRVTLDSMAQGILTLGDDGRVDFFNQRLVELAGLPEPFLGARPTADDISRYELEHGHFGPDLVLLDEPARSALRRWMAGQRAEFPLSYTRRTLAGATLEVRTRHLPAGGLVRTFSDVTPYVEARRRLQDNEAQTRKLALVAAHTDSAVVITDAERRIEWVNEGFTRMTGYGLAEVVGRKAAAVLRGTRTDAAEVARMDAELVLRQRTAGELLHRAKNGREYWFAVEAQAILNDAGQVQNYVSIGRDVSERKAAELALRAARDQAQRASRAKSEFLSAMSHELRTPLNAILGFAQLLDRGAAEPDPSPPRRHVREILRAGEHLLGLIDDLLDLARIEAGKQRVTLQPLAVAEVVAECLQQVEPAARERRIALASSVAAGAPALVVADHGRLRQVLLNLLSNAVKYNRDAGRIEVCCAEDGPWLRIDVTDTGPGLSDDDQRRLFQDFERLAADRSGIKGAGIGLALSKRLVEMMDGEIGVRSQPGQGSTFWVRLARAPTGAAAPRPAVPAPAPNAAPPADADVRSVLYIEDDPVNLLLIQSALERLPQWRLSTATHPEAGLKMAAAERPDLILLDIQLPGIDGYEVLRRLRGAPLTRDIPVVAVSANAMADDRARGQAAGFAAYVTKPVDLSLLPEVMELAVAGAGVA